MNELVEVSVIDAHSPVAEWAKNIPIKIPSAFIEKYYLKNHGDIKIKWRENEYLLNIRAIPKTEKLQFVSYLRDLRMFTDSVPFSSKTPFSYQAVPQFLRSFAARIIGMRKGRNIHQWADFPMFPLDLSVDVFSDVLDIEYKKPEFTPVILTHDIDSREALKNLPIFIKEEEAVGAKSTNFVVPFKWKIDHGILSEIKQRGHEIGIHGFDHSNKMSFLDTLLIKERICKMHDLIQKYKIAGYRSPSLLRTRRLLKVLSEVFKYDSSIPTSGGLFPVPNNGCATARIFEVENICEIPISMPRDAALLFLGYKFEKVKRIWLECAELIRKSGGVITLLTHCENRFIKNGMLLSIYREFLQRIKSDKRFTFMTCEEVFNGRGIPN